MKNKIKKAQIQSRVVLYIIVGVMILILLIALIKAIIDFKKRQYEIMVKQFNEDLAEIISTIEYGSKEKVNLKLPDGVTEVCFADLSKREEILKSSLINRFPVMKNSIESGVRKNVFLIAGNEVKESMFVGDICFDNYPYYTCMMVFRNILDIYLEGKGRCALIIQEFAQCTDFETIPMPTGDNIFIKTYDAELKIPSGTSINFQGEKKEICLKPVLPPSPLDTDPDGLVSEVYSITPESATFSQDLLFTMRYYTELLPPKSKQENVKMKYYDSGSWTRLLNSIVNTAKKMIASPITSLKNYAVFGPEPPVAVIKVIGRAEPYIFDVNSQINFDASESHDESGNKVASYSWDFGGSGAIVSGTKTSEKPIYKYNEVGAYTVTLTVTDADGNGATTTAEILIININNVKDISKYSDIFLISRAEDWRDIIRLIPLTMWTDISGRVEYPYLVYDIHTGDLSQGELTKIMDKYSATTSAFFKTVPAGVSASVMGDYLTYWSTFEDIVLVDYNNQDAALMSALFASFLNAPLIFTDRNNPLTIDITGKNIYIIDSIDPAVDTSKASSTTTYTLDDISTTPKNPYSELYIEVIPSNALS